jgi:hypothetical protein
MANGFLEWMSGTSKQEYGDSLYDDREYKKWKQRQEKIYGKIGAAGDRYGEKANKFLGMYGADREEADRYRGKAETELGRSRGEIDKASSTFGRAEGDIQRSRDQQLAATQLMSDRDHYSNLKRRSGERRREASNARRGMESIRNKLGRPSEDSGLTQSLLDAFKRTTASNRKIIDQNVAQLKMTNPAAAARLTQDFNEQTLSSFGQLKQKGKFSDEQLKNSRLTQESAMLMNQTSLLNLEAREDQGLNAVHSGQISNRFNAGNAALNTAGAMGNLGRNYLSGAGAYSNLGSQYGRMGSSLDSRGTAALNMTSRYEGLKYGTLQDRMSISNKGVERQDKFRMSDAAARARVDSFNNSRANMGLQNTMGLVRTAASVAGAAATGGASIYVEAALKLAEAKAKREADEKKQGGYSYDIEDTSSSSPDLRFNPNANDFSYIGNTG